MAWLTQFLLGRPGFEYAFTSTTQPAAMTIDEAGIVVTQRNIAGDLKKSTLKVSCPTIKVSSTFLPIADRNILNSMVGIADTFLSFQTRDDWQQILDAATVINPTTLQLQNASSLKLSQALVAAGQPSIITINSIITGYAGFGYGLGGFGEGGYDTSNFNPGTITYNDLTKQVTFTNPLPDPTLPVFVTYTYKGWLVNLEKFTPQYQGGWVDRATYDFQLIGA